MADLPAGVLLGCQREHWCILADGHEGECKLAMGAEVSCICGHLKLAHDFGSSRTGGCCCQLENGELVCDCPAFRQSGN